MTHNNVSGVSVQVPKYCSFTPFATAALRNWAKLGESSLKPRATLNFISSEMMGGMGVVL